jgi:translocation protein SEC63
LSRIYKAFIGLSDGDIGAVARTDAEKKKAETLKKESKGLNALKSTGFLINLALTVVFTIIFFVLLYNVSQDGEVNSFDPFSILEIDSAADLKAIKKAYRDKSLKYHPDKNPNNPSAEAKFMMVAKAYEALTDETAKENWEKYGNPDGKQSMAVSIGLPSWLLDTNNRNLVLITYLIIMVGVIPYCVWRYYSKSSMYGEKDVMYDSYSWYHHTLGENTLIKSLPEFFAGSAEFRQRNIPKDQKEKEEIGQIMNSVRANMQKPKYNHPVLVKGNVLLHAHLLRQTAALSEAAREDLKYMLRMSGPLVDAMISVCKYQDNLATAIHCIQFGQYITQGCWIKDSDLLQLPYFTHEEVKHIQKAKTKADSIVAYRQLADEQKKGLADFTETQKADILSCLNNVIPNITVETKVYVDDDEDDKVYEGDLCTVEVNITRNNLKDGEKAGLVHAPMFPFPRQEAWWIVLGTREGKIISIDKVADPSKVFSHKIKFLAPRVGSYEFDLHVISNAYIGLDQKDKVSLTTLDNTVLPEYTIHPEDAQLDDEPTLFEEMLNANIEQDSDSDDDDDDEDDDDDDDAPQSAADQKKAALRDARKAAAAGEDDDNDDDEVEEVYAQK